MLPIANRNLSNRIHFIRGHKVMLDHDLAEVYGVTTKRLNQQVQRNKERFPDDFMFQLTAIEVDSLRLQSATLKPTLRGKHRKYRPYAFTEHGAVMVSAVLRTTVAIQASIEIARAFVRLRQILSEHKELTQKLKELESRITVHDDHLAAIFKAIRDLMDPPTPRKRKIGFRAS